MSEDIVERLRSSSRRHYYGQHYEHAEMLENAADEIDRLRAYVERLTRERDEARGNAETFRNSMYSLEERVVELMQERGKALNELDTIYGALGTADAEGAPDAAASIGGLFDRAEAAERKVKKLLDVLIEVESECYVGMSDDIRARIDAALAEAENE